MKYTILTISFLSLLFVNVTLANNNLPTKLNTTIQYEHDSLNRIFKQTLNIPDWFWLQNAENITATVEVIPNPIRNILAFKMNNNITGTMEVEFLDNKGEILKTVVFEKNANITHEVITMQDLPQGLYTMRIKQNNYYAFKRIVKQ